MTQLDIFGDVLAAEQQADDEAACRAMALDARERASIDIGYALLWVSANHWPAGDTPEHRRAVDLAYQEMERGGLGHLVPGAKGSCVTCDHHVMVHKDCKHYCEATGCGCRKLDRIEHVDLRAELLEDGTLRIRPRGEQLRELWAKYRGAAA